MHKKKFLLGVIVLLFLFKGFSAYAGFGGMYILKITNSNGDLLKIEKLVKR
jgi:hypothetical protein